MLALLLALSGCSNDVPEAEVLDSAALNETRPVPIDKPKLALLTSLPLVFAEDGFSLENSGSVVLEALEETYDVDLVATTEAASLEGHDLLLMAHAPTQTAEGLVELDAWVRGGGRVLLLADPRLVWQSSLPLGDRRRPLSAFPDTGLLGHWGVRLEGPVDDGPQLMGDGETSVLVAARGRLVPASENCIAESEEFVALCTVGAGKALVIGDADFLMTGQGGLDGPTEGNIPFLMAQLARL